MKCNYLQCSDKTNDAGMSLHNREGQRVFYDMEPGQEMHLECYVRYCVEKAIKERLMNWDWEEIPIQVVCPACGSKKIWRVMGTVLDCYPPLEPFQCQDCKEKFHAQSFELKKMEGETDKDGT